MGWLGRRRRRGVATKLTITSENIAESKIAAIRILKIEALSCLNLKEHYIK
jgi:hypothetical protein